MQTGDSQPVGRQVVTEVAAVCHRCGIWITGPEQGRRALDAQGHLHTWSGEPYQFQVCRECWAAVLAATKVR